MEADLSNQRSPEQAVAEEQDGSSSSARSYDCIFCRRGFSNAQALGGHMNIHRKDRSKLKQQPPTHSRSPLDIANKVIPPYYPATRRFMSRLDHAGEEKGLVFKWPRINPREQEIPGARTWEIWPRQQPFVVQRPWRGDGPSYNLHQPQQPERFGGQLAVVELDLELRLGPGPRSSSMSLQEFL